MGLGISSNIFVPASLIFDDGSLHLNLDLRNIRAHTNSQPLNVITMNRCKVCSTPVLQRKNRKKLGVLSTNCCINKLVDLATQSGWDWDHEDARKKFAKGYVCLTCYCTVEKCSSLECLLQTQTHRQHWSMHVQSLSLAPRHLLTLSDLVVISLL